MATDERIFEIKRIDGRKLILEKKDGTTWPFEFKPGQIHFSIIETLEDRQKNGWSALGFAKFISKDNKLEFVEILS